MDLVDSASAKSITVGTHSGIARILMKVFDSEAENLRENRDHIFLIFAVHAVFLESGFTLCGRTMNTPVSCFRYTLPSLVDLEGSSIVETVILKFSRLDTYLIIYGCLGSNDSEMRRLVLDAVEFAPLMVYLFRASEEIFSLTSPDKGRISKFWKIVKDELSSPLLTDLCDRAELLPPPCFISLPSELISHILELLPVADVARIACVCSELKHLSSSDEYWEKKCKEEFGILYVRDGRWKEKFNSCRKNKNRAKRLRIVPHILPSNMPISRSRPPDQIVFFNGGQLILPHYACTPEILGFLAEYIG